MFSHKDIPQVAAPRGNTKKYLSLGVAMLTCPCHAPILVAVLAGTALGGWLSQYLGVVVLAMAAIFILSLVYGLGGKGSRTAEPQTVAPGEPEQETEGAWKGSQV